MLVHIRELSCLLNYEDWDYENTELLAAYKIKSYDKFVNFIQTLKKHGKDLIIGDEWYTVEDYALVFPKDNTQVPCLHVYVISY